MKKIFTILFLFLALFSFAGKINVNEAKTVATNFYKFKTGATLPPTLKLTYTKKGVNGLVDYYVFNVAPNGFVMISGDDNVIPVLAYSTESNFHGNANSPIQHWLRKASGRMDSVINRRVHIISLKTKALWDTYKSGNLNSAPPVNTTLQPSVAPLVATTWNQYPLYNDLCPYNPADEEQCVTGCVATAMAQVMKYWDYPPIGVGSYSYNDNINYNYGVLSMNFANTPFKWDSMPLNLSSSTTLHEDTAVATLMYACGVSVAMEYGDLDEGGSGAFVVFNSGGPSGVCSGGVCAQCALETYFGYNPNIQAVLQASYTTGGWDTLFMTELDSSRPIICYGYDVNGYGGHCWVADGYESSGLFHMNWGWGGEDNGYFSLLDLDPSPYDFEDNDGALIKIYPASTVTNNCLSPLDITASDILANSAVFTWNGASSSNEYLFEYQESEASSWIIDTVKTTTISLSGLQPTTLYNVQIYNLCSSVLSSPAIYSFTTSNTNCAVATGLYGATTEFSYTSAEIVFNCNPVWNAVGYISRYRTLGSSTWTTNSEISNLGMVGYETTPGTVFQWQVETVCDSVNGLPVYSNWSVYDTATVTNASCIPEICPCSQHNITDSTAEVTWTNLAISNEVNATVSYYSLDNPSVIYTVTTTNDSAKLTGLLYNTFYEWNVTINCSGNAGSSTATSWTEFLTPVNCNPPTNLTISYLTDSSVTVYWTPPLLNQGATVENYSFYIYPASGGIEYSETGLSPFPDSLNWPGSNGSKTGRMYREPYPAIQ